MKSLKVSGSRPFYAEDVTIALIGVVMFCYRFEAKLLPEGASHPASRLGIVVGVVGVLAFISEGLYQMVLRRAYQMSDGETLARVHRQVVAVILLCYLALIGGLHMAGVGLGIRNLPASFTFVVGNAVTLLMVRLMKRRGWLGLGT